MYDTLSGAGVGKVNSTEDDYTQEAACGDMDR